MLSTNDLDELLVVRQYRQIKEKGHGDIEVSVKDGKMVKLWTIDKTDVEEELRGLRRVREIKS